MTYAFSSVSSLSLILSVSPTWARKLVLFVFTVLLYFYYFLLFIVLLYFLKNKLLVYAVIFNTSFHIFNLQTISPFCVFSFPFLDSDP